MYITDECIRGRDDCTAIERIDGWDTSPEDMESSDPTSFCCCGVSTKESRKLDRDCFRLCFKNSIVDDITDNDEQDLTSLLTVISKALLYKAVVKVNKGEVEVVRI